MNPRRAKLLRQATAYERKLTDSQVFYERKYTDGQFGQLNLVAQEHRIFHEREHLLYEDAIEKAATSLGTQLKVLEADLDRVREETRGYLTVERFEREHQTLSDKFEVAVATIGEKVSAEERVTLRQGAKDELVASLASNRRWLIGISITLVFSIIGTVVLFLEHLP